MSSYSDLLHRHQKEVNAFPIKWAFSDSQFNQAMRELGLDPSDTDAIIGIGGGGFMRKSDNEAFHAMLERHQQERAEAIASDKDGTGYLYEMFLYELGNHEYIFTFDPDETFAACDVTAEQVENDPVMKLALPNSTATRIVMKANLREWRTIFSLRTSKAAYPEMRELMTLLQNAAKAHVPVVFDDLEVAE